MNVCRTSSFSDITETARSATYEADKHPILSKLGGWPKQDGPNTEEGQTL